jgi:hypothetical protein
VAGLAIVFIAVAAFVAGRLFSDTESTDPLNTSVTAAGAPKQPASASAESPATASDPVADSSELAAASDLPAAGSGETAVATDASSATGSAVPSGEGDAGESAAVAAGSGATAEQKAVPRDAAFQLVGLDAAVTSMAMTDDGRFLVLSHLTDNLVSVYDILQNKVVAAVTIESPRSVLCRADHVYVASYGEGTISVLTRPGGWKLINELQVAHSNIVHLAAPGTEFFSDQLIVTCHGDGNKASYEDSHIFLVNITSDSCQELSRAAMAEVSFDGRLLVTQGSFNLSPSGGMSAYNYDDYVKSRGKAEAIFRGGIQQTPYLYQVSRSGYWIGDKVILGGVPVAQIGDLPGQLIIPDLSQKIVYTLSQEVMHAHRFNSAMSEIGMRRVEYPASIEHFSTIHHHLYRMRDYILDHPVAYTHGDRLFLFVLTSSGGQLLRAEMAAFEPADSATELPLAVGNSQTESPQPAPQPQIAKTDEPSSPAAAEANMTVRLPAATELFDGLPQVISAEREFRFTASIPEQVEVELMSEHEGLTMDRHGVIRWRPGQDQVGVHELKLRISGNDNNSIDRLQIEVIDADLFTAIDGDISKLNDFETLELDLDHYALSDGPESEHVLLLQGDLLRFLDGDGVTVKARKKLPGRYKFIEERQSGFVAVAQTPAPVLEILDKRRMTVSQRIDLTSAGIRIMEITDLAVHPHEDMAFVAVKHDIELPRYTVLIVDERTGTVRAPGIPGTWVEVAPDGSRLYTGYRDIYERGSRFHINPDWRLIEIPEYGSIDMLMAWDIGVGQSLTLTQIIRQAGGNGNGIRMSADGQRLTYLSHVGYPMHSNNLAGIHAVDFNQPDVAYQTKGRAITKELTYHPSLPIVAVPGSGSAVLFHRETGKVIDNGLLLPASGLGEDVKVERLFFSPDGGHLTFLCTGGETGRYLRSVALRKSLLELPKPVVRRRPEQRPRETVVKVRRGELQALNRAGRQQTLTPKDIGQKYMDSVVLVLTDSGSGTGFVVGDTGYLLTAAHVVDTGGNIRVVYHSTADSGEFKSDQAAATIIRMDHQLDVALLKMSAADNLPRVVLADDERPDTGEEVTVIGNPGLGTEILNRTMTTGIVSNPDRVFEGLHYVQTSAAVNPGNSGGPMFDSRGHVIGLVTLKGAIEGAAFAVPAKELREFLQQAIDGK